MKKSAGLFIFLLFFAAFVTFLVPRVLHVVKLSARSENLEKELSQLKYQNLALENELRLLKNDPVYLEKVAREKFKKAKQGEIVYKVVRE